MQKQFVTYETALKLKELGFDEPCFGWFNEDGKLLQLPNVNVFWNCNNQIHYNCKLTTLFKKSRMLNMCTAPLYQQVTDWFREKHNIHISIPNYYDGWSIDIRGFKQNINLEYHSEPGICLENYYEAREQAILKVIELCQKEK